MAWFKDLFGKKPAATGAQRRALEPHVALAPDGHALALLHEVHLARGDLEAALAARGRALEALHPESALAKELRGRDPSIAPPIAAPP